MSDSPLLSKMDALLKKHRGGSEAAPGGDPEAASLGATSLGAVSHAPPQKKAPSADHVPPPGAWLPVLTDVIERGNPPAAVVAAHATITPPTEPASVTAPPPAVAPTPTESDVLAEQLLNDLAPRLSEVMEKQVAAELRKNLDQTVANLLSQLDVNVREIVRDAVAEKLKQPRDPSA